MHDKGDGGGEAHVQKFKVAIFKKRWLVTFKRDSLSSLNSKYADMNVKSILKEAK